MSSEIWETYLLLLSSRLEDGVEVAPKLVDLIGFFHLFNGRNCIARLIFLFHFVPAQYLFIIHMSHALEIIKDPFVEIEAPMVETMCALGIGLACSIRKKN